MGSVFEPVVIKNVLKLTLSTKEKAEFDDTWGKNVKSHVDGWLRKKENEGKLREQLDWEAEVMEYVDFVHKQTSVRANSSKTASSLKSQIPFLGPKFIPPAFVHLMRRQNMPTIPPHTSYLVPLNVIHPFYYPTLLRNCPQCDSQDILWDGWTATGAREVHGIRQEERAIGYQMRCKACKVKYGKGGCDTNSSKGYCFATTSKFFWENWKPCKIPRTIPFFLFRCAVTHELYDLVIEFRPSLTSAGIADHIEQLHLLEYWQEMHEYLLTISMISATKQSTLTFQRLTLEMLSVYNDKSKYNGNSISSDLVTDIYLDFMKKSGQEDSENYCRSRQVKSISMDNTFKSAAKAVVVDKDRERVKMMKGGVLSAINELSETLAWRFCQSASPAEIGEMLEGIVARCRTLGTPEPESAIVDNCCAVKNKIKGVMPGIHVILDVFHFMLRYLAVLISGTKNKYRSEVARDIRNSIIRLPASKGQPAKYWPKDVQEERLEAAYKKWQDNGDVWTGSAAKVHLDQLSHVKKGCLSRHREDISMDGSPIEGSHKGWNSLQRAQPSGLEMYAALAHDFVLCRNIRIGQAHIEKKTKGFSDKFLSFTAGSHHVGLVSSVASLFNNIRQKQKQTQLPQLPTLPIVESGESFGLVKSEHTQSFSGLFTIKDEAEDEEMLDQIDHLIENLDQDRFVSNLGVNPDDVQGLDLLSAPHTVADSSYSDALGLISKKRGISDLADMPEGADSSKRAKIVGSIASFSMSVPPGSVESTPSPTLVGDADLDSRQLIGLGVDNDLQSISQGSLLAGSERSDLEHSELEPSLMLVTSTFFGVQGTAAQPVPLEPRSSGTKLNHKEQTLLLHEAQTRSQRLFELATHTNPQSLAIKGDDEFYLFMEMRTELQWTSYKMTAPKWADVTTAYNERLAAICKHKGVRFVAKNPRALMDKLGEIEPEISKHINSGNFKSQSGSETFWKKNCEAVPLLVKQENLNTATGTNQHEAQGTKRRKIAVCSRCKTMMYPGPSGDSNNHKKGYCANGVAQKPRQQGEDLPDWPQPAGIFKAGTHFNPAKFLQTVRDLYNKVVDRSVEPADHSMEDEAFSRMLQSRTIVHEATSGGGQILFRLFDLENDISINPSMLVEVEGIKYLRIDSLDAIQTRDIAGASKQ